MPAKRLEGKLVAERVLAKLESRIGKQCSEGMRSPHLVMILVGNDRASKIYIRNKKSACRRVGIRVTDCQLPASTSQSTLLCQIDKFNADSDVNGVLVQLPLPAQIDASRITSHIDPDKDVDGFHPCNIGRLVLRTPGLRPATPKGIMQLLEYTEQEIRGLDAVVVGASNHVGRPMMLELLLAGCTVTTMHKFSRNIEDGVRKADILVSATGKPGLIRGAWIKPGAIVVDVGFTMGADDRLYGDVEFNPAAKQASWITPVPGGVGPMTIAALLDNTLLAAERQCHHQDDDASEK